jgi:hypothetical protein
LTPWTKNSEENKCLRKDQKNGGATNRLARHLSLGSGTVLFLVIDLGHKHLAIDGLNVRVIRVLLNQGIG